MLRPALIFLWRAGTKGDDLPNNFSIRPTVSVPPCIVLRVAAYRIKTISDLSGRGRELGLLVDLFPQGQGCGGRIGGRGHRGHHRRMFRTPGHHLVDIVDGDTAHGRPGYAEMRGDGL